MSSDEPDDRDDRDGPASLDPEELRLALAHAAQRDRGPTDPGSAEVLAALDRTRDDLARHGRDLVRDAPRMPPALLARIDRALAAERAPGRPPPNGPGTDRGHPWWRRGHGPARRAARRRGARVAAAVSAAVAVAAVLVLLLVVGGPGGPSGPPPTAGGPGPDAVRADVPVLARGDLDGGGGTALGAGLGRTDLGPLADPVRRAGCFQALGVAPGADLAGAREVLFEDRPAVLLVLTTGVAARFRILVVEAACGPGRPLVLAQRVVGR